MSSGGDLQPCGQNTNISSLHVLIIYISIDHRKNRVRVATAHATLVKIIALKHHRR